MMVPEPIFVATMIYAFALLVNDFKHILIVGIAAHLLLLGNCLNCFFSLPVLSGLSSDQNLTLSLQAAGAGYWVSLILELCHLALFTTTEIAYQKLKKKK